MKRIAVLVSHIQTKAPIIIKVGKIVAKGKVTQKELALLITYFLKLISSFYPGLKTASTAMPYLFKALDMLKSYNVGNKKNFNLIEILISVSIMVTFSSLVGSVYYKKLEETKEAFTKIEINNIMQCLIMYESRNDRSPLELNELVLSGDLPSLRKDSWGNDYVYVPHVDWSKLIEILEKNQEKELKYYMDAIQTLSRTLVNISVPIDPMLIISAAHHSAFVFSLGSKSPIFPEDLLNITRERMKQVMDMIKIVRDKAGMQLLQSINSLNV